MFLTSAGMLAERRVLKREDGMAGFRMKRQAYVMLMIATVSACGAGPAPVQTVTPARVVPPQPVRDATGNILTVPVTVPDGTEFTAQTLDFLSSQTAAVGDAVKLEVDNSVIVDGAIAIAAGTPVKGTVAAVTKAGRMGKSGNISIRIESTEAVDQQKVRLRATKGQVADEATGSTIALTLIVSPLFLLRRGNDVAYQPGTHITVYTDDKLNVRAWKR
jgi:hypothetical protein